MKLFFLLLTVPIFYIACKQAASQTQNNAGDSLSSAGPKSNVIACPPGSKLDVAKIEQITGMKGVEKNGEY